jgi:hypothetical protein
MPVILAVWVLHQPRQVVHETTNSKIRAKWTAGMAQVVECLLCKLEALSSNPTNERNEKGGMGLPGMHEALGYIPSNGG